MVMMSSVMMVTCVKVEMELVQASLNFKNTHLLLRGDGARLHLHN